MSNSPRAKLRKQRRSRLSKHGRDILAKQHFGDRFVYKGRPLMRGQVKTDLMKEAPSASESIMARIQTMRKATGGIE